MAAGNACFFGKGKVNLLLNFKNMIKRHVKSRRNKSTRQFLGMKGLTERSFITHNQVELVFFIIKPHNLAVLSEENINIKLHGLTTVLKSVESVEWVCQNSRESFENNKDFLKKRGTEEKESAVRSLCEMDRAFLDNIQLEMATLREFLLVLRFKNQRETDIVGQINRFEKLLNEQGFEARRAEKPDIQRMLAVYFEQNISQTRFPDFDGGQFI
jgi:hypothetical protein